MFLPSSPRDVAEMPSAGRRREHPVAATLVAMNKRAGPAPVEVAGKQLPVAVVRASDADRERIATIVNDAVGTGRLTIAEADERLKLIYAARFRHELHELITDLPDESWEPRRPEGRRASARLRVHAAIALVLSVLLITRWVASDVPFFWPAGPMFLLFGSLLMHARFVSWSHGGAGAA